MKDLKQLVKDMRNNLDNVTVELLIVDKNSTEDVEKNYMVIKFNDKKHTIYKSIVNFENILNIVSFSLLNDDLNIEQDDEEFLDDLEYIYEELEATVYTKMYLDTENEKTIIH